MRDINELFSQMVELVDSSPWDLRYVSPDSAGALGAQDCRIYLVLTETGWLTHAAVAMADLMAAEQWLAESGLSHDEVARVTSVAANSVKAVDVSPEECELYLAFAAYWFIGTEAFQELRKAATENIHAFAFLYQAKSGALILRPGFTIFGDVDLLDMQTLLEFTREVVTKDASGHGRVGQQLLGQGGAVLHPALS